MKTTSLTSAIVSGLLAKALLLSAHGQDFPVISEFMATNEDTITLESGETPDWIEIHNPGTVVFDLSGWHLTDDVGLPTRWAFPAGSTLAPGAYLVVFASGIDFTDPSGNLHTNFQLSGAGEYLALTNPAGVLQQEFSPTFPEQYSDVSFGFPPGAESPGYFTTPTPGAANNTSVQGFVKDTKFSVKRGFFDNPFALLVTSSTPGASIYYTLDGNDPTLASPSVDSPDPTSTPSLALDIADTTIVRAFAAKPGFISSNIDTQSYFFTNSVIAHPTMSPTITNHPTWGPQMRDALLEIPSISLITQKAIPDDVPTVAEPEEIPVSIEMIFPDGREGFQANAGIERFGGIYSIFDKQALRVSFKEIYGPKKLKFDLFGDTPYGGHSAVNTFNQIILRNGSHDAIFHEGYPRPRNGAFVRNRYYFDRQLEMGHPSLRGKFVHVYLNGVYNGQYHLMERPNADHMATHYGGLEEDYDVMKGRSGILNTEGERVAWDAMVASASTGNFEAIQNFMDVDNYIDYMLLNFYGGNDHDWYPNHNWVAARKREDGATFKFFMWDNDFLNRRLPAVNATDNGGPANMFNTLKNNAEFKIRMADRAQKYFFNGGMLTKERVEADFNELGGRLARTIIPETARWGNYNSTFYTPNTFNDAIEWLATGFSATRAETVIGQMKSSLIGVFPETAAPSFSQQGGAVPVGYSLQITHEEGDLYYTTDGSDPRLTGGNVNPAAIKVGGPSSSTESIPAGSIWKFFDSGTDPGAGWTTSGFNDSAWGQGPTPFGFGSITNTSIATTVGGNPKVTFYCRKTFEMTDIAGIVGASVNIHADDGVIVYLNGVEIVRDNMPDGSVTSTTTASGGGNEGVFDPFEFDHTLLIEGTNLITVEVHNSAPTSNDMVFDLKLFHDRLNPNAVLSITETTGIKARVLNGSEWSALNEATFITDEPASSANLVISEIHYHPSDLQNGDAEFIELMNISDTRISLSGVMFTEGISYSFGDQDTLAPGERIVLVYSPAAFEAAYGGSIPVAGVYTSRLANEGEPLTLTAKDGSIIQTLRYNDKDPWPTIAGGTGYSLVLVAPTSGPDPALPQNWRSSISPGGTPGGSDSHSYLGSTDSELMEYATGATTGGNIQFLNGLAIFEHLRANGADDARITVQVSSDMEIWTSEGLELLSQSNQLNDTTKLRWALPYSADQKLFVRMLVTVQP